NFSIDTPEKQIYADSIPYKFLDTDSRATFFLNETTVKLVTITTHNADVHIHTLAYPPLLPEDVYQKLPVNQASYKIWGGIACIGLLATMLLFLYRKKPGKKAEFPVKPVRDLNHVDTANLQQIKKRTVSS